MEGTIVYQAGAGANVVVTAKPARLLKIIVGADVGSAILEVSDSATDGDIDVKIYLAGSTLLTSCGGCIEVNADFSKGITCDITNQTHLSFVYKNIGS